MGHVWSGAFNSPSQTRCTVITPAEPIHSSSEYEHIRAKSVEWNFAPMALHCGHQDQLVMGV